MITANNRYKFWPSFYSFSFKK